MQSPYQGSAFLGPVFLMFLRLCLYGGRVGYKIPGVHPVLPAAQQGLISSSCNKNIKNKDYVDCVWPAVNHMLSRMQCLDHVFKPEGGIGTALPPSHSMDLVRGGSPRKMRMVVSLEKEEHGC